MTASRTAAVDTLIHERHILVCTGSGGVGKTTTSAALAVRAAEAGRRVIVCTIDPARRLAQSLGLESLEGAPHRVDDAAFGGTPPSGELWAMMLDMKSTFDEMILDLTTAERAERIFSNPFYKHVSSSLAGTQEYMAMEKLWELHEEGRWELIIIDTPPTRSALDFLDAPKRMTDFLDGRFLKLLLWPYLKAGKGYLKALNFGARAVLNTVTRVTGSELFADVADFFAAFDGMYDQFKARAERVYELLGAKRTAFVVVAAPTDASLREAKYFIERLRSERMPLGGVVLNRSHAIEPSPGLEDPRALADRAGEGPLADALRLFADRRDLAVKEATLVAAMPQNVASWQVPDLAGDVYDVPALRAVGTALAAGRSG